MNTRDRPYYSKHYYQGGYQYDFIDDPSSYECGICLLCQRDPHQTSCGHRFCQSCLVTWLTQGRTCPHDNNNISLLDIFPDTIAHREIQQLRVSCPHCSLAYSLADIESHITSCHRTSESEPGVTESSVCPQCGELLSQEQSGPARHLVCPKQQVSCAFSNIGCTNKIYRKDMQEHMERYSTQHLQLLSEQVTKVKQMMQAERVLSREGEDSSQPQPQPRLIKELYQKVISLEQLQLEQEIKISELTSQLELMRTDREESLNRHTNGEYVWRIKQFSNYHQKLRNNHNFLIYSKGFYTSFYGYKVCLRSNLYISEGEEHLGVFVHFMRGENDDILEWPWQGRVTITLVHQGDSREHFSESLDSNHGSCAFQRPTGEINQIGIGFQEFFRINSLYSGGFVSQKFDNLIIKANLLSFNNEN